MCPEHEFYPMDKDLVPGIHLLHKPAGPSSFAALRAVAPPKLRTCHGGTLDPFAAGLLLVLVQPATQLFDLLHDVPKVYDVTLRWGTETDNGDPLGTVVRTASCDHLSPATIESAARSFLGWHDQIPPETSAKRIGGVRAYELAHRGQPVAPPPTPVYLHAIEWLSHNLPQSSRARLTVRGGFYVRSMVRDLARALDTAAHTAALHRISIGPYTDPSPAEIPHVTPLPWLPARTLRDHEIGHLKEGKTIAEDALAEPTWHLPPDFPAPPHAFVRGVHRDRLIFILEKSENGLRANRCLRGGMAAG